MISNLWPPSGVNLGGKRAKKWQNLIVFVKSLSRAKYLQSYIFLHEKSNENVRLPSTSSSDPYFDLTLYDESNEKIRLLPILDLDPL